MPWSSLSVDQFAPTSDEGHLILRYARPGPVRKIGFPIDLDRVSFAGTNRAFVAAAIQHYRTHPDQRPAIGTSAGLAAIPLAPGPTELPPPPSTRRRARTGLAGAALLVFATLLWIWTAATLDLSYGQQPFVFAVLAGLGLLVSAAFPGVSRPVPAPTPPAPTPSRAPWARDVTCG